MIARIKSIKPLDDYTLKVSFTDGTIVLYDVKEDIESLPGYDDLKNCNGLWQ